MKNRILHFACVCGFALGLLLFASARHATAQQNVTSASLSGDVADANGARVAGATVTATQLETNQQRTTNSDRDGRFRFPYLPVGNYRVTVDAPGFATAPQQVTLTVGQTLSVSIKLNVSGVAESVAVNDVPAIETVRTQLSETIRPAEIDQLPLNGRNYLDLALLVPAVSPTNTGSNQRFAETSAVPGQGISVAGQRNLYNSFIVDGLSANDDAADLTGTYF
ncbi:MAG TPA: carboxypeptidase-like regulatory domain-containing protein, partial [Pyrinomonadaceae bacterium]|nr:carboxypeptidase-like regulatory domain-containing protein [Pyrinomonadaceae bacterium]